VKVIQPQPKLVLLMQTSVQLALESVMVSYMQLLQEHPVNKLDFESASRVLSSDAAIRTMRHIAEAGNPGLFMSFIS